MVYKNTILIDLDGVLNEYIGVFDENNIPKIKEGADLFLKKLAEKYIVKLFTTRNKLLASKWVIDNHIDSYINDITNVKEPAFLYIDDRSLKFNGDYEKLLNDIDNFKVWYK